MYTYTHMERYTNAQMTDTLSCTHTLVQNAHVNTVKYHT